MPHTKFQVVFGPDDRIDLQMLIDGELRHTQVDLRDAPFAKAMLGEPDIQLALKAWLLKAAGPSWMHWTDVEAAALAAGVAFEDMTAAYSPGTDA